jgi:hypothetical protein
MPNGFFAGWKGKNIYFSETYRPWAWPVEYTLSVDYPVIDCGVVGQTLVVLTAVSPVLITGVSPSAMTIAKLTQVEPCLSANSVASTPEGVYYASPNGLVLVSPQGILPVTRSIVSRETWSKDYAPVIEDAVVYDSQYIAIGPSGNGFVFGANNDQPFVSNLINFPTITSMWTDPYTGEAHMMMGNDVYIWDSVYTPYSVSQWISKEFQFPRPINLGAMSVSFDTKYAIPTESVPSNVAVIDSNIPTGGPWPELVSIVGYNLVHGLTINGAPADGSYPPGNTAPVATWPYWYGVATDLPEISLPTDVECEVTILVDGEALWTGYIEDSVIYRLPSGYKSERWQIRIQTRVPVYNLQIAETAKELILV